ncbi:MAG TPA: 4a-hydroxytetrahydrobiopterin dehydratase [Abditibacteriaceae bacterium]
MKLEQKQIDTALQSLDGWTQYNDEIGKTFLFADFGDAMVFVNRVAELAQEANHHPDIDIRYNSVKLALSTHSEGGLTKKDINLARQIEEF